jgi:hypothetical protein
MPEVSDAQRTLTELRDACLALVRRYGTEHMLGGKSVIEFERAPFTIWLTPSGDVQCLDVWHDVELAAVLNLCWSGEALTLGSFRRGEWEWQLLELARQHE